MPFGREVFALKVVKIVPWTFAFLLWADPVRSKSPGTTVAPVVRTSNGADASISYGATSIDLGLPARILLLPLCTLL